MPSEAKSFQGVYNSKYEFVGAENLRAGLRQQTDAPRQKGQFDG
jgi:hypothetical protein